MTKNKKTKTNYIAHKLVESYRDSDGKPKHRVIMSLGTLEISRRRWKELAFILESRISGQQTFMENEADIASLADEIMKHNTFIRTIAQNKSETKESSDIQPIDLNSVTSALHRSLGPELVANTYWERLGFDEILKHCGFSPKQASLAKAVILGRLINPDSEYATWQWFQNNTALVELTNVDLSGIGKDGFYEIGDLLLENKETIEQSLLKKENTIFSNRTNIFLYDLTNTYFEGTCNNNNKANRGHSKEKRSDCPLVTLAIMIDSLGFPIHSKIYDGNKGEPATLNDMLVQLEKDTYTFVLSDKPVLIMDRGIATKENIELIKSKGFPYTVINRRETEKDFPKEFENIKSFMCLDTKTEIDSPETEKVIPEGWERIDIKSNVYVKKIEADAKCYVLSVSDGRMFKEQSMDSLKEQRFTEDMEKLKKSFEKGNIIVPLKIGERIGRIKAKYTTVSKFYDIKVTTSEDDKKVTDILWLKKPQRKERSTLTGCYVIETTQIDLSAQEIWKQYMQLTRVESVFQDLKSELGLRPVYHQTANRTESHLFIGVLAYHLLNAIEYSMKTAGKSIEWKTMKKLLSTHQRSTTILKDQNKKVYHIRGSSQPEPHHNELYRILKVKDILVRKKACIV
ncbi:MAG: IS1634 family transposase [bacterium]